MFLPQRDLRVSDADREDVMVLLKRHYSDGRLAEHELDSRAEAACRATFASQLRALLSDLPPIPVPAPPPPRAPWLRHALISLVAVVAVVLLAAALPSELSIIALIVIASTLFALAFTVAPMVLVVLGVVWLVRTVTGGRRRQPLPF